MLSKSSLISSPSFLKFLLLLQYLFFPTIKTEECIDVLHPRTLVFDSIKDLQTNNRSFNPRNVNFTGNYVAFNKSKMNLLEKNSFITYDSKFIEKLSLDNHDIKVIQNGTFISLKCLRYLELQKNAISSISKEIFNGDLAKLHELNLSENYITEIPEGTFINLMRLRKLDMAKNKLKVIHPDSFLGLAMLDELDLSHNYLNDFSPDVFQYFIHLTNLQLEYNRIQYLELDKCKNLKSLKVLNLANNALECFDTTYNYSFSLNLTELYLNGNLLIKMNPDGFQKSLPVLKIIDIENNPWGCLDLVPVVQTLNDSHVQYKGSTSIGPNVGGIACNRSIDTAKKNSSKYNEPTKFETTSELPDYYHKTETAAMKQNQSQNVQHLVTSEELDSIRHTQTVIICLLVIIGIFIMADVAVRCGCLNFWLNRRRQTFLDNDDGDDGSLLRDRF